MSIDRSLRLQQSLSRHRNVLKRAERIALMKSTERWTDESNALHLPKVGNRKAKSAGKKKAKGDEAAEAVAKK
jgi:small basic protein (TIGR04137 family)